IAIGRGKGEKRLWVAGQQIVRIAGPQNRGSVVLNQEKAQHAAAGKGQLLTNTRIQASGEYHLCLRFGRGRVALSGRQSAANSALIVLRDVNGQLIVKSTVPLGPIELQPDLLIGCPRNDIEIVVQQDAGFEFLKGRPAPKRRPANSASGRS